MSQLKFGTNKIALGFSSLLIAIPFLVYFYIVNHYTVDIPVWDDYVNPLDITNKAIEASPWKEKLLLLATPMNGHIPFLPRVLLYLQFLVGVTSCIKTALIVSNVGWMLATALIMYYCYRSLKLPIMYLIPIPYFMLSIAHWEAMDFYSSAFQMYWGSGLLVVGGLIAVASGRPLLASLLLLGGLFSSGGTLAAYPVCLLYYLLTRQWKGGIIFLVCSLAVAWLYVAVNPPGNNLHRIPAVDAIVLYTLTFLGNIMSTGQWDLSALAWTHRAIGASMIIIMFFFTWRQKNATAIKLIFFTIVLMGMMASYMRMDLYAFAVSRYAMYALLAATCSYIMFALHYKQSSNRSSLIPVALVAVIAIGLWAHSLLVCRTPLQSNHDQRVAHMRGYIETHDLGVLSEITWNVEHARGVLETSRKLGLYDYTRALSQ